MTILRFNELAHYGVRGMKWGIVRKRASSDGRVSGMPIDRKRSKKVPPTPSRSAGQRQEYRSLSNAEIQTRINRLQMERQYSQLLTERELQTNWKKRALSVIRKNAGLEYDAQTRQIIRSGVTTAIKTATG